jgi:archaellum component FlaC
LYEENGNQDYNKLLDNFYKLQELFNNQKKILAKLQEINQVQEQRIKELEEEIRNLTLDMADLS